MVARIILETVICVAIITVAGHFIGKLFKKSEEPDDDEE